MPVIRALIDAYKIWQGFLLDFPKTSRYTLGAKIDALFIDCISEIFSAASVTPNERLTHVRSAAATIDSLKFLLQASWEIRALDTKKYIAVSERLDSVGNMLGGWIKALLKTSPPYSGEKTG